MTTRQHHHTGDPLSLSTLTTSHSPHYSPTPNSTVQLVPSSSRPAPRPSPSSRGSPTLQPHPLPKIRSYKQSSRTLHYSPLQDPRASYAPSPVPSPRNDDAPPRVPRGPPPPASLTALRLALFGGPSRPCWSTSLARRSDLIRVRL